MSRFMTTGLRDYQLSMYQALCKAWKRHRSVMVQMPTGTGKTVLLAEVIRQQINTPPLTPPLKGVGSAYGQGVLIVAHRRELLEQIRETVESFGIDMEKDHVVVESIQKLARAEANSCVPSVASDQRSSASLFTLHFSLIVVDEAHHALARTYRVLWERWPEAKFLGLTATPCRLSGEPFTDLFDVLLQSHPIQEFIDRGWLSDFEYVSASPNSEAMQRIRSLGKRGSDGDYQTKELVTVMDVPESIEHLFKTYQHFAGGRKGIVYAINRDHARHIAAYYQARGVRCAVIDSKTPAEERKRMIEEYKAPEAPPTVPEGASKAPLSGGALSVLINVDIFSEGFDCPEVEFIQLARPTLSLSKYLQQVGRGMRVSDGKPHVLILDNVGLYQTFGLPTEERDWRQTFYGMASGKSLANGSRYVVLDDSGVAASADRELVNLQMVRIKKGGRRGAGLEIFLKDGRYGVRNNGRVSCPARFKEIVRLKDQGGFFAAGIYGGHEYGYYVEYASLIDSKGVDRNLRLFRDVEWKDGFFYSSYMPKGYKEGNLYWFVYWDPKGNCYYDCDPGFRTVAGVEVAEAYEHDGNREHRCHKLRYNTGSLSPRFRLKDIYYNKHILIARDYLVVKRDKNHAYRICGYLDGTVIVQDDDMSGYQQILLDGKKGERFSRVPEGTVRVSPVLNIYYMKELRLHSL